MNTNSTTEDEEFGLLPAFGGIVVFGPYADVHALLMEVGASLSGTIRLIFRRFSPGRLWIRAEDE